MIHLNSFVKTIFYSTFLYHNFLRLPFYYSQGKDEKSWLKKLWISSKRGVFEGLSIDEVLYIESNDHYLKVHLINSKELTFKESLTHFFDTKLSNYDGIFYRISRSYVINIKKVERIDAMYLYLEEDHKIPIPKNKRKTILEVIGILSDE